MSGSEVIVIACKIGLVLLLELRSTTFGTLPLSKGWGRPEAEINPQAQNDSRLETRLVSILTSLYFKLFNKLLVLPDTTINFGPSTQENSYC
jgi:hypothetical protein